MKIGEKFPFRYLSVRERFLFILVLLFSWGGIGFGFFLNSIGLIENPGNFVWGSVFGSIALCVLALLFEKKDIVSILTPLYAGIIFFTMELPLTVFLQVMYAATLTAMLWRLVNRFGPSGLIRHD
ncbi:hypothetical protein ACKUB1_02620 [Methanospirillum stamsii]|uniref:Uncharacterized protein n=1 Tax=Methanospirillum stamsii TaxID=1277351 RepID=A0A2V2N9W6_9EURY|nr:hypothetical protein [Methanospirillum stamsii]PWR72411.1 hypothetical protein DLD82_12550 [Methanospirillum stamsii]